MSVTSNHDINIYLHFNLFARIKKAGLYIFAHDLNDFFSDSFKLNVIKSGTYKIPPSSLIAFVEKLVCAPAPFQSPSMGLGSNVTITPKSSATR